MPHPHGTFTWADSVVPDVAEGRQFYAAVLGWEASAVAAPDAMAYTMFTKDGKVVAGMGPLTSSQQEMGIPPMWTSYVGVDDVDAIAARAAELGGNVVMPPMDIMEAGRMTYMMDPTGAAIGFWQAGQHSGADAFNDPGFITWNELATRDVEAAEAFYSELLPWKMETRDIGGGFMYTMITLNDRPNGGIFDMSSVMPDEVPAHWGVYFAVDDTDAAVAAATAAGGTVVMKPMDTVFGRMAGIADSQGATFRVIKLAQQG